MHEFTCPSCSNTSNYNAEDYLLLCPFCSATFRLDMETGQKELFGDHYIIPNTIDVGSVKALAVEWLKRLHHKPSLAEKEFFITDIQGLSIPYWIISCEGHTVWKGLVEKQRKGSKDSHKGGYLTETGQFRRSYRWAISARSNICETWGFTRLHEPQEEIYVEWDGFPLDSTFSRGKLTDTKDKNAYEARKFFEFKFSNGLPILGIQNSEEEALQRAQSHIHLYHYKLASLNVDFLIDNRTELEIAGIQLIHLPFWIVTYVFKPKTTLKYLFKPKEKQILIDGHQKGVLTGEIALVYNDKVAINAIVCGLVSILFLLLGKLWHPAFYFIALFGAIISVICLVIYNMRKIKKEEDDLKRKSAHFNTRPIPQRPDAQSA